MPTPGYDAWKTSPPEGPPDALEAVEGDLPAACPTCGAPVWDDGKLAAHVTLDIDHGVLVRCDAETAERSDEERVAEALMETPRTWVDEPCETTLASRACDCRDCYDWDAVRDAREGR